MVQRLESYFTERERAGRESRLQHPAGLARICDDAWRHFLTIGFPTTRDEEWRFTSVASIAQGAFTLSTPRAAAVSELDVASFRLPDAAAELVFVDGRYHASLSRGARPSGAVIESLAAVLETSSGRLERRLPLFDSCDRQPFAALNLAFLGDGAWIELSAGTDLPEPIHLLFIATGQEAGRPIMSHPRVLVGLGERSRASVVETYAGSSGVGYFTNAVTEAILSDHAILDHYLLQHEAASASHVGTIHVRAGRDARYDSHAINLGGALVRNDLTVVLDGEGAECALHGLYTSNGGRLVDNHTTIDHAKPRCGSREVYKGILADRSRGVFNGKIIVRPDAQGTDARQTNRALLLSDDARIDTTPQLEIFADDVKCTHGAAIGQLDDEALFYIRSRGLSEQAARRLLIHAFAADVVARMPIASVRAAVDARLQRQLGWALPGAA
jgi:Fe-S cluster assembly protein SufD